MIASQAARPAGVSLRDSAAISTTGDDAHGVSIATGGDVNATLAGTVSTGGSDSTAVHLATTGAVSVQLEGAAELTTAGENSHGLLVEHGGSGLVDVQLQDTAQITTTGEGASAVHIASSQGSVQFTQADGTSISSTGLKAQAIHLDADDLVVELGGHVDASGRQASGARLLSATGGIQLDVASTASLIAQGEQSTALGAEADQNVTASIAGTLASDGDGSSAVALRSTSGGVELDLTTTAVVNASGEDSIAIDVQAEQNATVNLAGSVSTIGADSTAVRMNSAQDIEATLGGQVSAAGAQAAGLRASSAAGSVHLQLDSESAVNADGKSAMALVADAQQQVLVTLAGMDPAAGGMGFPPEQKLSVTRAPLTAPDGATLIASGELGVAALVTSATDTVQVQLGAGSVIAGGWQSDDALPPLVMPAAGLLVSAAAGSSVINAGSIGATSDRALADAARWSGSVAGPLVVENSGEITGFVEHAQVPGNRFTNTADGTFHLRHLADTDGDGVRDTRRVSISDFGGTGSLFRNEGLLRLARGGPAAHIDGTHYYAPTTGIDRRNLGGHYDPSLVNQAQLVNLERFEHAGVIDLRGEHVGNSLVITSQSSAATPAGTATFVANGGVLHLGATFDANAVGGGSADMLVVDRTALGSAPTSIHLSLAPGELGAATTGNGIQLVEVRDPSSSASGVFTLSQQMASGLDHFSLHHNGIGADAVDGNWYLRNTIEDPENPGDEVPAYRASIPVLVLLPSQAARMGLASLGNYHDRIGQAYADRKDDGRGERHAAWMRIFGATGDVGRRTGSMAEQASRFARHGPSQAGDLMGMQAGQDLLAHTMDSGATQVVGLHVSLADLNSRVHSVYGGDSGSSHVDSTSGGLYWTFRGRGGGYVDAVVQATRYRSEAFVSGQALRIESDGKGYAASLEAGAPLPLRGGWQVEPQVQVVYQQLRMDDTRDNLAMVDHRTTRSLNGRAGSRILRNWISPAGQARSTWLRLHAWHDFGRQSASQVSSIGAAGADAMPVRADLGGTRGQLQLALAGELDRNFSAFFSSDYDFALDGHGGDGLGWRFGIRKFW